MFEDAERYFRFLGDLGLTKHLGSMAATHELVELTHISEGQTVLDVGTGVGATLPYLANELGCRVVAVDLLPRMIEQAQERVAARGAAGRVRFAAADARRLPFPEDTFDVVIMESLNVFFDQKAEAVAEYVRVTKPGGYVGMTEMTWLRQPAPERAAYYRRTVYADALQTEGWKALLREAGLEEVEGQAHPVNIPAEGRGRIQRYGCGGYVNVLANLARMVFRDPASRAFLRDVTSSVPRDMLADMGYGTYAGRKLGRGEGGRSG